MYRLKLRFVSISFFFAIACLVSSCSPATHKTAIPSVVKIGVIYPVSGGSASVGRDILHGLYLARDIINESHDVNSPLARTEGLPSLNNARIELVIRDSEGDAEIAAHHVEELVTTEGVCAIIGCYNSTVTAAASEQAEVLQVPFVTGLSTSPILTQRGLQWFFRTTPDDTMFSNNFFAFLRDLHLVKKGIISKDVVLVYENRLWGTGVARAEQAAAKRYGYTVRDDIPYVAESEQFAQECTQITKSMPAIILQASYTQDALRLFECYVKNKVNPIAILGMNAGFVDPEFIKTLGRNAEGVLSREVWALDISDRKPLIQRINTKFLEQFAVNMTGSSARAFTVLTVLATAINDAGSVENSAIRDGLRAIELKGEELIMPWDGVTFDSATGQNVLGKGIVVQVHDGEYKTVWPWHLAAQEIVWPKPAWSSE